MRVSGKRWFEAKAVRARSGVEGGSALGPRGAVGSGAGLAEGAACGAAGSGQRLCVCAGVCERAVAGGGGQGC